ncbi:MAG: hypothetical protein ACPL28_08565 [bacterium]
MNITEKTSVEELLSFYPELSKVFVELGMPCFVCGEAFWGTIEELGHKYSVDIEKIIKVLNEEKGKLNRKENK